MKIDLSWTPGLQAGEGEPGYKLLLTLLLTLETCDESDEETWPDQQNDNDKNNENDKDKDNGTYL